MAPNLLEITNHLEKKLGIQGIVLSDDSHLHHTHQNFQSTKAYLTVHLPKVKHLSRLTLHRQIMRYSQEICNQPIHAIAICVHSTVDSDTGI